MTSLADYSVWRNLGANQSVFSFSLEIESRLRAASRATSLQGGQRKLGQATNSRQPRTERLSRYIE